MEHRWTSPMDPGKRCAGGRPSTVREFILPRWSCSFAASGAGGELPTVPVARHEGRGRVGDDNATVGSGASRCRVHLLSAWRLW